MKKLLLTLIVSLVLCGSVFAQFPYESHWPDFQYTWGGNSGICAAIAINGHVYTVDDEGWDALEVAFFVGDEQRGNNGFLNRENVDEWGDPYPITNATAIGYDNPNEVVSFKMWDHINGVLYEECEVTYLDEPMVITTGPDYFQALFDEPYLPIILNFIGEEPTPTSYKLEIDPYEGQKDNYYLIASPVGEIDASMVEGLMTPNYDFYAFSQYGTEEEPDKEWINLRDQLDAEETVLLQPGAGYLYANSTGTDLEFPAGASVEGDEFEIDLIKEGNEGMDFLGWNLVGNPFTVVAYLNQPFYCMVNGAFVSKDAGDTLSAMNGAFVVATDEVTSVTFSKDAPGKAPSLALNLSNSGKVIDRAIVRFGQGQQLPKYQLFKNSTKVYIPMEGKDYAIVNSTKQGEMPVSFKAETNGTYTLSINTEAMGMSYLHLIDNHTGNDIDLLETPSYTFDARFTDRTNRFKLVYASNEDNDNTFAFISDGNIILNADANNATVQIIDMMGHILTSTNASHTTVLSTEGLASGVYVLRLVNGNDMKTQKIVIE